MLQINIFSEKRAHRKSAKRFANLKYSARIEQATLTFYLWDYLTQTVISYYKKLTMKHKNYDKLYLDILKIGRSRVGEGLSYKELTNLLTEKGYDFQNDCIQLAVKQWFFDSFHHRGQDDLKYNSIDDLENHLECNFILKGDSSLRLIEYDTSKNSSKAGWYSLIIALLAIAYTIYHDLKKDRETNNRATIQDQPTQNLLKTPEIKMSSPKRGDKNNRTIFLSDSVSKLGHSSDYKDTACKK